MQNNGNNKNKQDAMSQDNKNLGKPLDDESESPTISNPGTSTLRRTENCDDLKNLWRSTKSTDTNMSWENRSREDQAELKRKKN